MKRKYHMFFFSYTPVVAFSSCSISFCIRFTIFFLCLFCAGNLCIMSILSCPVLSNCLSRAHSDYI
ncbi:hypothetical protein BDW68DRAFT_159171 [Aspergillus falconensis]